MPRHCPKWPFGHGHSLTSGSLLAVARPLSPLAGAINAPALKTRTIRVKGKGWGWGLFSDGVLSALCPRHARSRRAHHVAGLVLVV